MLNKGGNLIPGKQFTDLTKASALKDSDIIAVHDGSGLKQSNMEDVTVYMSDKFSNPNLLINPDFKINQRWQAEYAYQTSGATKYTVDRFRVVFLNVKTASDGLLLNANGANAEGGYLSQVLEDAVKGDTILSFKVSAVVGNIEFGNLNSADNGNKLSVSSDGTYTVKGSNTKKVIAHLLKGSSCKIEWIKLEQGSIATPFVATNFVEEFMKCKRFFYKAPKALLAYGINAGLYIMSTEVMNMRDKGTVVIVGDGNDNVLRYEGNTKEIHFDESKCTASRTEGYIKVTLSPSNNLTNSKVVALDLNSVAITIDAEIY